MNRLIYSAGIVTAAIFFGCRTEKPAGTSSKQEPERPNILFIFTDDQRADAMGCAGNSVIKTPNIDNLAANGVRFTNCYVMGGHHGAICAPSRAMLMSGKSLFRVYDNLDGEMTMPKYFSQHGYETFGTGKWHNSVKSFEKSFQKGSDVFIGGMSDHFKVPCRNLDENGRLSEPMNKGFSTDVFAEAALNYIEEYAQGDQENPFFCYLSFTTPHDPRSPREDHIGMYKDEDMPLPENYKELPAFQFDDLNIRDETLAPWPREQEYIKKTIADYYALVSHMDARIGDIIALLKKEQLYENTIIVFASDNGLANGSHGLLGKQNLYEHSTQVPFILTGPGIPLNQQRDALVYLFDIFPTLSGLCGLPEPEDIDGTGLMPILTEESDEVRSSLYTAYRNTARAVRAGNWKLIWYLRIKHLQLFNLEEDPYELNNLAGLPEREEKINQMMDLIKEWHKATADTATLFPAATLPMEYDYTELKQTPDRHQPPYVLKRYFPEF
ncbi:MAG: sulfatase-like hydrolase/transferase [Mariniphaga sp.]